MQGCQAMVLQE